MGINIRWEDERGKPLAELLDGDYLVVRFLPPWDAYGFRCLRFVDPAGDTVFNQLQIPHLVWELETLLAKGNRDPKVEHHLRAVL